MADAVIYRDGCVKVEGADVLAVLAGAATDAAAAANMSAQQAGQSASQAAGTIAAALAPFGVRNLFDFRAMKMETYINAAGVEVAREQDGNAGNYYSTDFIAVTPGQKLILNKSNGDSNIARHFYTANRSPLIDNPDGSGNAGYYGAIVAGQAITVPPGAYFARFCLQRFNAYWTDLMVIPGDVLPAMYLPFGAPMAMARAILGEWWGAKVGVQGDSIMSLAQNNPGTTAGPKLMERASAVLGFAEVRNFAQGGRKMVDALKRADGSAMTQVDVAGLDGFVLSLMTNDALFGPTPVGAVDDPVTAATFAGQAKKAYEQIQAWAIAANGQPIPFLFGAAPRMAELGGGDSIAPYADMIRRIAALYGCPVNDLHARSGFNATTCGTYTRDGVHPEDRYGYPRITAVTVATFQGAFGRSAGGYKTST